MLLRGMVALVVTVPVELVPHDCADGKPVRRPGRELSHPSSWVPVRAGRRISSILKSKWAPTDGPVAPDAHRKQNTDRLQPRPPSSPRPWALRLAGLRLLEPATRSYKFQAGAAIRGGGEGWFEHQSRGLVKKTGRTPVGPILRVLPSAMSASTESYANLQTSVGINVIILIPLIKPLALKLPCRAA